MGYLCCLMPLMIIQTFTVVILRLLAINLGLLSIRYLASAVTMLKDYQAAWMWLGAAVICLVSGVVVWLVAPWVAKLVCRKLPESAAPINASLRDLYSAVFVLLGMYLVATTFGPSLSWLYYAATHPSGDQGVNFYEFFNSASQLIIGVVLVGSAGKFARKLAQKQG